MNLQDFYFELPKELIAQYPQEKRTASRLMVLHKDSETVEHRLFFDIKEYLSEGDLLVLNNTKVIKANLQGKRKTGGKVSLILYKEYPENNLRALVKGNVKDGEVIIVGDTEILLNHVEEGIYEATLLKGTFEQLVNNYGKMPLPPYIKREPEKLDEERYQTVFGAKEGAVAAPTAALHFDNKLLYELTEKGVQVVYVTLHVGVGTFLPVKTEKIEEHRMLPEYFEITEETAEKINYAKKSGKNIIFCGTTTVRAVESAAEKGILKPGKGKADIFIYPGYRFQIVEKMITNFHLPKATPLFLVSALAGREKLLNAYKIAIEERYRFFSYGDAMLII